ncbi:MAG: hypothetical protein OXE40_09080 [Gammaproteobacteria bacterium]|nr:hypothetical protein [Gammaproteobacteria bacterium]
MALYRVTFRDGSVQYVEAARMTKFRNMGLWMFTAADDTLIEAFAGRKVGTIKVALE